MTFEELVPLLVWRVGDLRGFTPALLTDALTVESVEKAGVEVPPGLERALVGFRRRRTVDREALCRRFLRERAEGMVRGAKAHLRAGRRRMAEGKDVTLTMSVVEARALRRLLELAGDEFSNHGCNDFSVKSELNGTAEDGKALLRAMAASGAADEEQLSDSGEYLYDWQLFRHFEVCVEKALSEAL